MKDKGLLILTVLLCLSAGCGGKTEQQVGWWPDGGIRYRVNVRKDKDGKYIRHGRSIHWRYNGNKEVDGYWKDGKKHGGWMAWYENGQKKEDGSWKDGKPHGEWTTWYKNGQKKEIGEWDEGRPVGQWLTWAEDGKPLAAKREKQFEAMEVPDYSAEWTMQT